MIKMFRELKGSYRYIILILALLFGQVICDLSLPAYTSDIINVGVQQGGIPDSVPDRISEQSMNQLFLFMNETEQERVKRYYRLEDGEYTHEKLTKEEREELNLIFGIPMLAVSELKDPLVAAKIEENMQLPQETDIFQAAITYIKQEYTELGMNPEKIQMNYVKTAGLKMLLLAALSMVLAVAVTFLSCRVAAKLGFDLRNKVYRKVISFSSKEMNQFSTSSLITRSTNDIQQVQMVFTMLFRVILYASILGVGGVIKVLQTEASMTWILGVAVIAILLIVAVLFAVAMPRFKKLQELIDNLNLVSREILTGIPVIRAFSREKHEEERFEKANDRLTRVNLFVNRIMTFMMPLMTLLMNGISVLIIYVGAHKIDAGNIQVGDMMAFIQYAMQIIMAFLMITAMSIMLPRAGVAANRILEILDTESSIRNPEIPKQPVEGRKGEVEFDHVCFSYPGAEEEVLTDISFTAKQGETIAFIGSTGSGKSTLINLIPRFFDVTSGAVRVDGVDVRDMYLDDLRARLGYVP